MGFSSVKKQIVDDAENRKALFERFKTSQKYAQGDPWTKRTGKDGIERHEFTPVGEGSAYA